MRIIGIILIFCSAAAVIMFYEKTEKEKIRKSEDLLKMVYFVNLNVLEKKMILSNAFFETKGVVSEYIDMFL